MKPLPEIERGLEQALQILSGPGRNYQPEVWLLVATLVGEADLALAEWRRQDPSFTSPLFDRVMDEFRDTTANFTNRAFLRATRAARRRNPPLFSSTG